MKTINVQMNRKYATKIDKGYPMLDKTSLIEGYKNFEEGTLLNLFEGKKFIAKAYYGRQNKGYGWVLTHNKQEAIDIEFFCVHFHTAFQRRQTYVDDPSTNAYRLFNGEGDGVGGLTVDYLDGHCLVTWYSLGIYGYKEIIIEALQRVVHPKSIYEKKRFDQKGHYISDDDFLVGEKPEFPILVKENGVVFPVYLNDGPMIGFFLDQKDVRNKLRKTYVKGKRVLNTFSYTGAFSVYAALGGAKETISVDLAKRSRPRTREVFQVNGIDPDKQHIIVEDVFEYFKYAVKKALLFDVVILDPPSFARSKKRTFSVANNYSELLEEAIAITRSKGIIVASTNYSNGDMSWFKHQVKKAFVNQKCGYEIVESYQLPADFPHNEHLKVSNYLKVLFIKKL